MTIQKTREVRDVSIRFFATRAQTPNPRYASMIVVVRDIVEAIIVTIAISLNLSCFFN